MSEQLTKYRVKAGCEISHDNRDYFAGEEVELTPELALFHSPNLEMPEPKSTAKKPSD